LTDKPVDVPVRHTKVVDLDKSLYSFSDSDYSLLKANLAQDPYLGHSTDKVNHEYLFRGLNVHYIVYHDHEGISVLISGIRPPEAVSWKGKVVKVGRKTLELVKEIKGLLDLFGNGE